MASALLLLVLLLGAAHETAAQGNTTFSYNNFEPDQAASELIATGDARLSGGDLWLTGDRFSSYGRVMNSRQVQFCNSSTGQMASFSTDFTFVIQKKDPTAVNADGFAFLIAPNLDPPSSNTYGRWLGLFEPGKNGNSTNKLVAVEFDTFKNSPPDYPEFQDIDNNHVGVDVNGIVSIKASSLTDYGVFLGSGRPIAARITYNASLQRLQVYVSTNSSKNMGSPVLEHSINLCAYIYESSYVGFSGGAGYANVDFHRIKSWKFSSSLSRTFFTKKTPTPQGPAGAKGSSSPPTFRMLFIIVVCYVSLLLLTMGG